MPLERKFKTNDTINTSGKMYLNIFPLSVGFLDRNKNDLLRTWTTCIWVTAAKQMFCWFRSRDCATILLFVYIWAVTIHQLTIRFVSRFLTHGSIHPTIFFNLKSIIFKTYRTIYLMQHLITNNLEHWTDLNRKNTTKV